MVAGTMAPRNADGVPTGGVTGIGKRYADDGYRVTYVDYPTHLWPVGVIPYDTDVAIGKAATERAVSSYQSRCPGKPVVVSGYSQGARIAGDVLSDVGNGRSQGIEAEGVSGELYSDPRRDGRDGSNGVENSLLTFMPGMTMSGPRSGGFGAVPVTQVCAEGDGVCDVPDPQADPLGAADSLLGYFLKHGYYPGRMNSAPGADPRWGDMTCEPQTAQTQDCLVAQRPAAVMAAEQVARNDAVRTSGAPDMSPVVAEIYANRGDLGLEPARSAEPASEWAARPITLDATIGVAGMVQLDATRHWGGADDLTLGVTVGIGLDPTGNGGDVLIPPTEVASVQATVPMIDGRRLLDAALRLPKT